MKPPEARACKVSFPQRVAIIKKHETIVIVSSCVVMAFWSFASLVGRTCGPSPENPDVVDFVDSKNSDRDVKAAHLRLCNILTNVKCVNE